MHSIVARTSRPAWLEEEGPGACLLMNFAFLRAKKAFDPINDNTKQDKQPHFDELLLMEHTYIYAQIVSHNLCQALN